MYIDWRFPCIYIFLPYIQKMHLFFCETQKMHLCNKAYDVTRYLQHLIKKDTVSCIRELEQGKL